MQVGIVDEIAHPARPEHVDEFPAEIMTLGSGLVAAQADRADQLVVDLEFAAAATRQRRQIVFFRIAERRDAHDLEFTVENLESEIIGQGGIHAAKGIRVVELLQFADAAVFAEGEKHVGIFALDVIAEDRGLLFRLVQQVSAGGMGHLVFDGYDLRLIGRNVQLLQRLPQISKIAPVTAIAVEQAVQAAVGGVPVAPGIMPAGRAEQADRSIGNRDAVNFRCANPRDLQALPHRVIGHLVAGVPAPRQPFLFHGRYEFSAAKQRGRGIMPDRPSQPESVFRHFRSIAVRENQQPLSPCYTVLRFAHSVGRFRSRARCRAAPACPAAGGSVPVDRKALRTPGPNRP